ncbi:MAG: DUF2141 domain-containing protein [Pseudomonadota bacterium]
MKYKFTIAFVGGLWAVLWTQLVSADTLTIVIKNVASDKGAIMVQILNSETQFMGEGQIAAQTQRPVAGEMRFTAHLPPGDYAFRVMHDENDNGKLDSNFVGIPTEPWAFSNNATGNFGPAKWADAKFSLSGETTQTITLNK